ncbi:hypothetical protein [Streptomyces sp. RKAG293]|uniref:hypothetical protein n=1 Tax=Streptomyces sp. RKAG293 TaxID=2893403 RepID=UPI0020347F5B|nr:hypothetical protein [Streptomyces sp. RKAG293]MCM2419083.1 hypothetical protein [Streptomyces sp. RKAG293]
MRLALWHGPSPTRNSSSSSRSAGMPLTASSWRPGVSLCRDITAQSASSASRNA